MTSKWRISADAFWRERISSFRIEKSADIIEGAILSIILILILILILNDGRWKMEYVFFFF